MTKLRTFLQIPLLGLILYIGSVSGYQIIRAAQSGAIPYADWQGYAHFVLAALEIIILIRVYRRLSPDAQRPSLPDQAG